MRQASRRLWIGVATVLGLALPAAAQAATTSLEQGTARYVDAAGAKNDLNVTLRRDPDGGVDPLGWSVSFLEYEPPLEGGPGCETGFVSATRVCTSGGVAPAALNVDLGGGDDQVAVVNEQPGTPTRVTVVGGPGDDALSTYQTRARLDGGDGNDVLAPDDRPTALSVPPEATPGGVIHGGTGTDTVTYQGAFSRIDVSLDGTPNDGRTGENDDVAPDVENVEAGDAGGTLVGSAVANALTGGGGDDRLVGAAGRDRLTGNGGTDTVDALDARGGDRVDCGSGADVAWVDAGDLVAADSCERVAWAPSPPSALRYRSGRIAIALSCPGASAGACRGMLRLTAARGGEATVVARGAYAVPRGARAAVSVAPTRSGRAALARAATLRALLLLAPRGAEPAAGRTVTVRG